MRKSDFHYFQGKASWARIQTPDLEYKAWSIKVHLNPESMAKFKELQKGDGKAEGILNQIKTDEDGEFVTFRRPMSKTWEGKETMLTPPVVVDKNNMPTTVDIGNGSDVTVKVNRYTYTKPFKKGTGSAIRMEAVKIENLVPYSPGDYTPAEAKQASGLDAIAPQLF